MAATLFSKQALKGLLAPYFTGDAEIKIDVPPAQCKGDFAVPVFALAKIKKSNPAAIAADIASTLTLEGSGFQAVSAQGGFLNFVLDRVHYTRGVAADLSGAHFGLSDLEQNAHKTIVIDYSSPNVAKEMHVGHLRSTLIGDSLRRLFLFLGYRVIAQNHLGDWGTQFGMLIEYVVEHRKDFLDDTQVSIGDLNALYQAAKQQDDRDPAFAERARQRVVLLQQKDPQTIVLWQALIAESLRHFTEVYRQLGVLLTEVDLKPESSYNEDLASTVADLSKQGLITVDRGASCIFIEGFEREGKPIPMIVQKSDGGFLYHTTDLAALRYRVSKLKADCLVYVVDVRQSDHFKLLFSVAQKAQWLPERVQAVHVAFGTILGSDNKPFKTREGGTIRLMEFLQEAIKRADVLIQEKAPGLSEEARSILARQLGIGAIKYADLNGDRKNDYVFDWDRLLSFEGNTAPYLQYAVVRMRSLLEKAGVEGMIKPEAFELALLQEDKEFALIKKLAEFPESIQRAATRFEPHHIAVYVFQLAQAFTAFYDAVPILKTEEKSLRKARLWLVQQVARVMPVALDLLGIECPDRM